MRKPKKFLRFDLKHFQFARKVQIHDQILSSWIAPRAVAVSGFVASFRLLEVRRRRLLLCRFAKIKRILFGFTCALVEWFLIIVHCLSPSLVEKNRPM
jgi:hypothetical protein